MRPLTAFVALAALAAWATSAHAQPSPPPALDFPPPISAGDMPNYCVFANRVYSLGSGLCLGRTGYICMPPIGPPTGNRAYWASKDDQTFTRPLCN
jgi:hypothetical protein